MQLLHRESEDSGATWPLSSLSGGLLVAPAEGQLVLLVLASAAAAEERHQNKQQRDAHTHDEAFSLAFFLFGQWHGGVSFRLEGPR